ncbi:DUF1893 domain-containing protein [Chloroflexota bacterium]
MYTNLFNEFLTSKNTLNVYEDGRLIYASKKDGLLPLLEYIDKFAHRHQVVIFDKLMGNAAALLAIKASCSEVYSPLGSQIAVRTLDKYNIIYHISEIVPYIQRDDGSYMCPMEKLSIDMRPEEFYEAIRDMANMEVHIDDALPVEESSERRTGSDRI